MKIHYTEKQLMAFVDDALNETTYNQIKAHLKTCGQCAGYVEQMRTIFSDLDRLESPPLNNEVAANTKKLWKILQQKDQYQSQNTSYSGAARFHRALAIGAVAAGLAIGFLFGNVARQGLIGNEFSDQTYTVVLQENGESISDAYVSLIINEGREDL